MTPEETREHVRRRLSELGWNVHIGRAGYDKIFEATGGVENEANRICHKLIAFGAQADSREITDATVDIVVTDGAPRDERPPRGQARGTDDMDRAAIERLATILEGRIRELGERVPPAAMAPPAPSPSQEARPTVLVVRAAQPARARTAEALARDFDVLQAADGARAWQLLLEHPNVDAVVLERVFAEANGHSLTRRIREEGAAHSFATVPIIVLGERSGDPVQVRASAGTVHVPEDVDPRELRARVLASYKASRLPERRAPAPARARPAEVLVADARFPRAAARRPPRRFASTLAITLTATALLALALVATFYLSRHPEALGLSTPRATHATDGVLPSAAGESEAPDEPRAPGAPTDEAARAQARATPPERPGAAAAGGGRTGQRAAAEPSGDSAANGPRAPPAAPDRDSPADTRLGRAEAETEGRVPPLARAAVPEPPRSTRPGDTPGPSGAGDDAAGAAADDGRALWERVERRDAAAADTERRDRASSPSDDERAIARAPAADEGAASTGERAPAAASRPPAMAGTASDAPAVAATEPSVRASGPSASPARTPAAQSPAAAPAPALPRADRRAGTAAAGTTEANEAETDKAEAGTAETDTAEAGTAAGANDVTRERRSDASAAAAPMPRNERLPESEAPTPARPQASAGQIAPTDNQASSARDPNASAPAGSRSARASPRSAQATSRIAQPPEGRTPALRQAPATAPPAPSDRRALGEDDTTVAPRTTPDTASIPDGETRTADERAGANSGPAGPDAQPAEEPATPAAPQAQPQSRTRLATARPPAAAATARPEPAELITRDELVSLISRFASMYEAGDLEQFLGLFAADARTNDRVGRDGIRRDYQALFGSTDRREMNLGPLSWEVEGNQAYGWGEFDVTVRRESDRERFRYTGSLTLVVQKVDGRLRIVRLFHGQQRAGS